MKLLVFWNTRSTSTLGRASQKMQLFDTVKSSLFDLCVTARFPNVYCFPFLKLSLLEWVSNISINKQIYKYIRIEVLPGLGSTWFLTAQTLGYRVWIQLKEWECVYIFLFEFSYAQKGTRIYRTQSKGEFQRIE